MRRAITESTATVTWLVATAGSGKTSLCIDFAENNSAPVAWLRVDETDRDVAGFFHFLAQALVHGGTVSGWTPPELLPEHLLVPKGYIRIFLRSLAERIADNAVLVIDDAHYCQDSPFFGLFLERCIDELPVGVRVLVASRNSPPDICARIVTHGHMQAIDGEAMAFTPAETRQLLAVYEVCDQQIAQAIFDCSRGWAIGIVLIGSLIRRRGGVRPTALDEPLSDLAADYIANEVFAMFPPDEQEFLLSICFLPHFSAEAAREISSVQTAQAILERRARGGGLVFAYEGGQFGLHDLFRQFLQTRAASRLSADRRLALIEQSIRRLAADGDVDEAIELALEHGLLTIAGTLIDTHAATAYGAARHQTLARWILSIPQDRRGTWQHFWLGRSVYASDSALAREALLIACQGFAAEGNPVYRYMSLALAIASYSFNGAAKESIREVLRKHVNPDDYERLPNVEARSNFAFAVFAALLVAEPGHRDFRLWEDRALEALDNVGDRWVATRIFTWLAIHFYFSGNYKRILALGIRADELARSNDLPPYAHYLSYFGLLFIALVGDRASLESTYQESLAAGETTGFRNLDGHYALNRAVGHLLDGNLPACEAMLEGVAAATPSGHFNLLGHLNSVRAWAANWRGDTLAAREYAELARQAGRKFGSIPYEVWSSVSEGVADALSDAPGLAANLVALRRLADAANYPLGRIHADLLEAWYWLRHSDTSAACAFLQRGLNALGEHSDGYLTSAVPQVLQPLCRLAFEKGIEVGVAEKVVKAFRLRPPADAGPCWPWPVAVRCFGHFNLLVNGNRLESTGKSKHRQLELLKYLAAHAPDPVQQTDTADALWPDAEGDAARRSLDTTLSRLRGLIGKECIRVEDGAMWLAPEHCWVDARFLDRMLAEFEEGDDALRPEVMTAFLQALRGELLAGDSSTWILARREYWHKRVSRIVGARVARMAAGGAADAAVELAERMLEIWPHSDHLTATLMRLLIDQGRDAQALVVFEHFRLTTLARIGGAVPRQLQLLAASIQDRVGDRIHARLSPVARLQ